MNFQLSISVPFVTIQQYSQLTGMAVGTIKDKIGKGDIIIKSKKLPREQPLVNMIAMHKIAMKEAEMKVAQDMFVIALLKTIDQLFPTLLTK